MRLVADSREDYKQLSIVQKLMTQRFKLERDIDAESTMTLALKSFINTSIEKSYERPGTSASVANGANAIETDDKSLFIAYIVTAATRRKKLAIEYRDAKGNVSKRLIEPFNWKNDQVVAWCHERSAWRQFKPNQIVRMAITDEDFDRSEDIEIQASDAKTMAYIVGA